jgi:hypothetical protein
VNRLTLMDFAQLTDAIDADVRAEQHRRSSGDGR